MQGILGILAESPRIPVARLDSCGRGPHGAARTFEVFDDHLVRQVVPARGRPYEHRCPLESYQELAHTAEELGDIGFTVEELAAKADLPMTRAAVALAFWKERGCVTTRCKRNYPASNILVEDAMIEYHALAENG